jgi:lipopolysaccharide export system protein LptA
MGATFSKIFILCLFIGFLFPTLSLYADLESNSEASDDKPQAPTGSISITADHMTADDAARLVTFTGRVVARQGDLIISCDVMRVYYVPTAPPTDTPGSGAPDLADPANLEISTTKIPNPTRSSQEIERVESEGAVKIQQGERLAVGQSALYLAKSTPRRLILTGEARVWQGQNSVTGHQITYYLDEDRSVVNSSDGQRVRAFYDQGSGKN